MKHEDMGTTHETYTALNGAVHIICLSKYVNNYIHQCHAPV